MFRDLKTQALPVEDITPVWPVSLDIPNYLEEIYWWAYVHPRAVKFFDRHALVNLILFGNYRRLRDDALAKALQGKTSVTEIIRVTQDEAAA